MILRVYLLSWSDVLQQREDSWQDGGVSLRARRCSFYRCSPPPEQTPVEVQNEWCIPRGYRISERKQADQTSITRITHWEIFILQRAP